MSLFIHNEVQAKLLYTSQFNEGRCRRRSRKGKKSTIKQGPKIFYVVPYSGWDNMQQFAHSLYVIW
jgi:hypothetical protein